MSSPVENVVVGVSGGVGGGIAVGAAGAAGAAGDGNGGSGGDSGAMEVEDGKEAPPTEFTTSLGTYVLKSVLGLGGLSEVFLAERDGKEYALKLFLKGKGMHPEGTLFLYFFFICF